jgi:hypothetical protein
VGLRKIGRWINNVATKRAVAGPIEIAIALFPKLIRRIARRELDPGADGRSKYPTGGLHNLAERERLKLEHTRDHALLNGILETVPVAILAKEPSQRR